MSRQLCSLSVNYSLLEIYSFAWTQSHAASLQDHRNPGANGRGSYPGGTGPPSLGRVAVLLAVIARVAGTSSPVLI